MTKRWGALFVVGGIVLAGCGKKDEESEPTAVAKVTQEATRPETPPRPEPKVLERGAYVASLAGCVLCHTAIGPQGPQMDKAYGGGLSVEEKFGTWTSPNISMDEETGIGKWTDAQIVAAIREGTRPDGSKLYPIMPWPLYNNMTDDDAKALVAFLRTLPKVANKIERSQLPAVEMPLPPAKRVDPVGDAVGHGAYLANLMHCAMCHTPSTDQGPDMSKAFSGGFEMSLPPQFGTGKLYTSNLTPDKDTGIGKWSEGDIVEALKTMTRPDGKPIVGPMMFYAPLWSKLTDEDALAIANFLKSLPPVKNKVPKSSFKMNMPPPGPPPTK